MCSSLSSRGFEKIEYISFIKGRIEKIGFKIFFHTSIVLFFIPFEKHKSIGQNLCSIERGKSVCSDSSLMNRAWPVFFIWTQVQARLEDGLRTAANYVSTQYFVLMIGCFRHACFHGLRTPNEGINQKYLKNWADVADKICFGRT